MKGMIRPTPVVVSEKAVVPEKNLISPPPTQFTHEVIRPEPYYYASAGESTQPDGEFPAGTKVMLLVSNGGRHCRVVSDQGLYVEIAQDALKKL